ncbi:MAG: hypothetical protein KKB20_29580 [Proteobacteria bacterium]|nr:hypothetical protein [Pseudomonadota bacterium]
MLTRGDDYPIHQTPEPIAYAGTDRNFYDRYFFNGYARDGHLFFAAALGVYPQLNVMDASFCFLFDDRQYNLHASRVLGMERMDTRVGPVAVEVVEPLRRLRVVVDENDYGLRADIRFQGRTRAVEEPPFLYRIGPRTIMNYTRLTQNGTWSGWIELAGRRFDLNDEGFWGTRDRSWGIRPVGVSDPQPVVPPALPQFYWLWAPLNFEDGASLYDVNTDAAGRPWHRSAVWAPLGDGATEEMASSESRLAFKSGTRHARSAELIFHPGNRPATRIRLDPSFNFYMTGLGYLNPEWGHGYFKGEQAVGFDVLDLKTLDESDLRHLHVQAFCEALMTDGEGREKRGVGVLEQMIIGPHEPSGFKDLFDPAD